MIEADHKQPLEVSDLEKKIIRQVEYYFGDINLVRDNFLKKEIEKEEGWVSLDTLLTFKRLAALTNDKTVIADSLKKSTSGLIEINDDKSKIRRTLNLPVPEMNDDRKKERDERTVNCKGFPKDSVLNDIIEFFSTYDGVVNVVMRNYLDRLTGLWHFKGSVFVNFQSVADAENFLKIESVKYQDTELIRKKIKTNKEENGKRNDELPIGSVIKLNGFANRAKKIITREVIKKSIEKHGIAVAYIYFMVRYRTAWVRLSEEGSSLELKKKLKENGGNGKLKLDLQYGDAELRVRVLEGEEEQQFLKRAKGDMASRRRYSRKERLRKRSRRPRKRRRRVNCRKDFCDGVQTEIC